MTFTVDLKPEIEAGLIAQARSKGVSVDDYVRELIEQLAGRSLTQMLGADEWEKAFDEWVENSPDVPHLPDEALRRESLYRQD